MSNEILSQAQASGIELGPELESVMAEGQPVQSTIQQPAAKEPVAPIADQVESRLQSLTQEAPEAVEPAKEDTKTDDDLAWLDIPEDIGLEDMKEPLDLPETPEAKKFADDFKQYLGFDVTELREGISTFKQMQQEIENYRAQRSADAQLKTLKQEWGVEGTDFDSRMAKVVERFNKYPPEMKAKLDGIEGAKLIWAKIQQEESMRKPDVPQFERSRSVGVTGGQRPTFTQREIDSMDSATYERNADAIYYAYANGLVQK